MNNYIDDYASDYYVLRVLYVARKIRQIEKLLELKGVPRSQWSKYRAFALQVINKNLETEEYILEVGS